MLRQIAPPTMLSIGSISQEDVLRPAGKLECHTMVSSTNTQRFEGSKRSKVEWVGEADQHHG